MSQAALDSTSGYYNRIVIDIKLCIPQEQKIQADISECPIVAEKQHIIIF